MGGKGGRGRMRTRTRTGMARSSSQTATTTTTTTSRNGGKSGSSRGIIGRESQKEREMEMNGGAWGKAASSMNADSLAVDIPAVKGILVHSHTQPQAHAHLHPASDQPGHARSEAEPRASTLDSSTNTDSNYTHSNNNPVLAPLLKLLPSHIDPKVIKKLLKDVHPSAFGTYRTKEAWRRENPDILFSGMGSTSCSSNHTHRGDLYPEENSGCGGCSSSPPESISSYADYESDVSSSSSPHPSLPSLSTFLSVPYNHTMHRRLSSSSMASACTCGSTTSSRSSSIKFAPLPEHDLLNRERSEKSSIMGIAGRVNLLSGKFTKDLGEEEEEKEKDLIPPEGSDDSEDIDLTNEDTLTSTSKELSGLNEQRPLGVTLEEVRFH